VTVLRLDRYPVGSDRSSAFEALLPEYLAAIREAAGALWADAARTSGGHYLVLSEWRTAADLDAWEGSGADTGFTQAADVLLEGDVGRRRFAAG
jgi:quinol monooxygenase YgiN